MELRRVECKMIDSSLPGRESRVAIVAVKLKPRAIRDIRAAILQLSYWLQEKPSKQGYLLLIEPGISQNRLAEEWARARQVFRTDIADRMWIGTYRDDKLFGLSRDLLRETEEQLRQIGREETLSHEAILPKPYYSAEVLKLLIFLWILRSDRTSGWISEDPLPFKYKIDIPAGPLTSTWLADKVGCTFRTISNALDAIGSALFRHPNQSVELKYFPRHAWEELLVLSDKSRMTMRFTNRSDQPRSPESLVKRLERLRRDDIAIGGVLGAKRIYPELDLTGTPRLDLTVHSPNRRRDISFLRQLDPGLKEWDRSDPPPSLVVHFLRRKESFFKVDCNGVIWADPVECLLDLQEAWLEPQALQFHSAIIPENANRWPNSKT